MLRIVILPAAVSPANIISQKPRGFSITFRIGKYHSGQSPEYHFFVHRRSKHRILSAKIRYLSVFRSYRRQHKFCTAFFLMKPLRRAFFVRHASVGALQGPGCPLPAAHERFVQSDMKKQTPPTCHCEAPKGPWQSRRTRSDNRAASAESQAFWRDVEDAVHYKVCAIGDCATKPITCLALTERRYRRNRFVRFYRQPVSCAGSAPGGACPSPTMACAVGGSATKPITCMAVTDRRYRRNRFVRFYRQPVSYAGSAPGPAVRAPTFPFAVSKNSPGEGFHSSRNVI